MKAVLSAIAFLIILTFSSCATPDIGRKYKFIEPNSKLNTNTGYLKVYTSNYIEKGTAWDDPVYEVYKGYTIYTQDGEFIMDVDKSYGNPVLVKLNEDKYIVIAELHKNIINSFQIDIEKGKIIEIDSNMIENPFASM